MIQHKGKVMYKNISLLHVFQFLLLNCTHVHNIFNESVNQDFVQILKPFPRATKADIYCTVSRYC